MLHAPLLLLLGIALQVPPKLSGELKNSSESIPPVFLFEGSADLPNKAIVDAYLYHGAPHWGTELYRGRSMVRDGKFTQEFPVFPKKNFPGRYIVRLIFDPEIQNLATPGFTGARIDLTSQFGTLDDLTRESKAVRDQLASDIRIFSALGDEVRAKLKELQGKTDPALWDPLLKGWRDRMNDIVRRTNPRKIPEFAVLHLNSIADSGIEHLGRILMASAQCALLGQTEAAVEGLTRLHQAVEKYAGDILDPKLTERRQVNELLQEVRTHCRQTAALPGQPTLTARRRFVEMSQMLDRSFPEDVHPLILELSACGTAFFAAVADSKDEAKALLATLEQILDKLGAEITKPK